MCNTRTVAGQPISPFQCIGVSGPSSRFVLCLVLISHADRLDHASNDKPITRAISIRNATVTEDSCFDFFRRLSMKCQYLAQPRWASRAITR